MTPWPKVKTVSVVKPYILHVEFVNGEQGEVDLQDALWGEAFAPLKAPAFFARVYVENGAVTWPNGADFAPEFLYVRLQKGATA